MDLLGKKKKKKIENIEEPILNPIPDKNNGQKQISADRIETIQEMLKEQGLEIRPVGSDSASSPKIAMTQDAAIKLLKHLCTPPKDKTPELTYLTSLQAQQLTCWGMLEEVVRNPGNNADDLHKVFRELFYQHRKSVERWFPMQLLALAGMQEEDSEFGKNLKIGGLG